MYRYDRSLEERKHDFDLFARHHVQAECDVDAGALDFDDLIPYIHALTDEHIERFRTGEPVYGSLIPLCGLSLETGKLDALPPLVDALAGRNPLFTFRPWPTCWLPNLLLPLPDDIPSCYHNFEAYFSPRLRDHEGRRFEERRYIIEWYAQHGPAIKDWYESARDELAWDDWQWFYRWRTDTP